MEVEQAAEVSAPETADLKAPDKTLAHDDEKENIPNGNTNLQVKEAHNDEDDGTGSDGFELIDVKENFDSAKVEEEMAVPRSTTVDTSPVTEEGEAQEEKTTAHEEQSVAANTRHLDSSMLNQQTQQLEKLTRRIEELESEKDKLVTDLTEAENKQSLHYSSLQEAQSSLGMKDKELAEATESLKELGSELETSKRRIQEIEAELDSSADKLHKLEELKDERSLHAAQEAKRASELDKMLELAQSNMKEMEKHISSLQEEVKDRKSVV